ncbi:MAG: DNA primase, partial [Syntrophomonadaceae bacterium]|nr:DNA primase [Syntrophomonadaceae bacterium]
EDDFNLRETDQISFRLTNVVSGSASMVNIAQYPVSHLSFEMDPASEQNIGIRCTLKLYKPGWVFVFTKRKREYSRWFNHPDRGDEWDWTPFREYFDDYFEGKPWWLDSVDLNREAAEFYARLLWSAEGSEARDYLQRRGISEDTARRFQLGFAPDQWRALLEHFQRRGFRSEEMVRSGLVKRSQGGDTYFDLFRHRLVFPIRDGSGRIVGFGGRALADGEQPKYLNSPETAAFSKRQHLFGLFEARERLRQVNEAVLVEGYMDCLQLHQHGVDHAVAALGTAFTAQQARLLRRHVQEVHVVYDADESGQRQALRAVEVLQAEGLRVDVVVLPPHQDPDDYIRAVGKEEFVRLVKNYKKTPIEFRLQRCLETAGELDLARKLEVLRELYPQLTALDSRIEVEHHLQLMGRTLDIPDAALRRDFEYWQRRSAGAGRRPPAGAGRSTDGKRAAHSFEERLAALMLRDREVLAAVQEGLGLDFFGDQTLRELARRAAGNEGVRSAGNGELLDPFLAADPQLESAYARLAMVEPSMLPGPLEVAEFIRRERRARRERQWQALAAEVRRLRDQGGFADILRTLLRVEAQTRIQEGGTTT